MQDTSRARELLDRGAYAEAAEAFLRMGELASAARAFVCAKAYDRAAHCYEMANKPLDAARLYIQIRFWRKAAQLYLQGGDKTRAELALQQWRQEEEPKRAEAQAQPPPGQAASAGRASAAPVARPEPDPWPAGELWKAMRAGDFAGAAKAYVRDGTQSGWTLLGEATSQKAFLGLGETLSVARDYAVAAEAFRRAGEMLRAAQCLSLAGLNEEASDLFMRSGQKVLAAQHLEKARAWESAAAVYRDCNMLLDAARCHEKDDEPSKAAALYLKAKKPDLALPLLQAVPPHHRLFAQCRLLAAKILFQKNQRELALGMLAPMLGAEPHSDPELETYYQVAVLLDQGGEADKAREAYNKLQRTRFGYKDVTTKLEQLGKTAAKAPPKPAQGTPAPAADLSPLRDCSLFNRLSLEDLRHLTAAGEILAPSPGQVLLKGGQPDGGLYVVLAGGLALTPDPSDPGLAVGFLGPGDYVGLGSLVPSPPRPNALAAQPGTKLLFLPRLTLEPLLATEPELGFRLFRSVADHLAQTLAATTKKI